MVHVEVFTYGARSMSKSAAAAFPYLLSLPIEVFDERIRYPLSGVPMHCTVMYWFSLPEVGYASEDLYADIEDAIKVVGRAMHHLSIVLTSEKRDFFGPDSKTPVHVLKYNPLLNQLHTQILLRLIRKGCSFKEEKWIGAGYRPHVSDTEGRIFAIGSGYEVMRMHLLLKDPTHLSVMRTFLLS